jgi:selenocysteine-specific elongation factor
VKHLIMGTAGHVDHGKTALVRALTGIECDTHKAEKARGITINLGFAHMALPSGDGIGIIDVPGHRDFVNTMVGGASGIDFALLVVAADDGIMPQTREHLQIMELLGIRSGLVAVTKTDLVEDDLLAMALEEVGEALPGTFLEGAPVVPVSSISGEGIEELKSAIADIAAGLEERPGSEVFRLYADRIFTVEGFGTVVTGSVIGGTLRLGSDAYLLPAGKKLRVRRLERHGLEVEEVRCGDRASINLAGLDRDEFRRGMIISDRPLASTTMIDARLRLFPQRRDLGLWTQVLFHLGTYEEQARVHLIDRDRLVGGDSALVQIVLESPCVAQYGDRFVIRNSSSDLTLGGGEVIDPAPLHHRRRPEKLIAGMTRLAGGKMSELIAAEIRKRYRPVSHREIADILNLAESDVREALAADLGEAVVKYTSEEGIYLLVAEVEQDLRDKLSTALGNYHARHPLQEWGRTVEELAGLVGLEGQRFGEAALQLMLARMEGEGRVKRVERTWALARHSVNVGAELRGHVDYVSGELRECRMQTPLMSDLSRGAERRGVSAGELDEILRYLVRKREAYFVEGNYLHCSVVDRCRKMLTSELARGGPGLTVARFRDLVGGNRKICLLLLALYDSEGITRREGDVRVLTEKGRSAGE